MHKINAILIILTALTITACTPVEPWERERLAHDCMQVPVDTDQARIDAKTEAAREATTGGVNNAGGGCGCN